MKLTHPTHWVAQKRPFCQNAHISETARLILAHFMSVLGDVRSQERDITFLAAHTFNQNDFCPPKTDDNEDNSFDNSELVRPEQPT